MCGIAGIISKGDASPNLLKVSLQKMSEAMANRGPDASGFWKSPDAKVYFTHRRLSIIDLDERSNQPMVSCSGRYVICFNGEIYNYIELRRKLVADGFLFRTSSDTEVILAMFEKYGESMLTKLRGMFAIAIWDSFDKKLFLARDPYGIKPLYYSNISGHFLFSSQVKSLLKSELISKTADPIGQAGFWLTGSVPDPYTWFADIKSLKSGHFAWIDSQQRILIKSFWDINDSWRKLDNQNLQKKDLSEYVREQVTSSIKAHLVADVPVGVFLSGGVDSTTVAALIRENSSKEVTGITISFNEFEGQHHDETPLAVKIAKKYDIRHYVRKVTKKEFHDDLPAILSSMDQPTLDGINTWYASKAAKECGLKVVMSGIGGDELFFGYPSFKQIPSLYSKYKLITHLPLGNKIFQLGGKAMEKKSGNARWGLISKYAKTLHGCYWLKRGLFLPSQLEELMGKDLAEQANSMYSPEKYIYDQSGELSLDSIIAVGQLESTCYLKNQLLRDTDWASMHHGVEVRTPLVDAWLLNSMKQVFAQLKNESHKTYLANCPTSPIPEYITKRVKTGFGVPLNSWLNSSNSSTSQSGLDSQNWAKVLTKEIYP